MRLTSKHKIVCVLLSVILLLCGCTLNVPWLSQDPLTALQTWLKKDSSFTVAYQYTNLAINGITQQTEQTFASDGSWYFKNHQESWDHQSGYEAEENAEFYYRYENSQLVCYNSINGDPAQRTVLTPQQKAEIDQSKADIVGVPGLLPDYLQDLSVTSGTDTATIAFKLPVDKVLSDSTFLSTFLESVFYLSDSAYKSEYNAFVLCVFETDPQTFQPKSLTYDFSQIKPYVLSQGAQSGEAVFDIDFVTMSYTFNYDFPDTIEIPAQLIT